MTVDPLEPNFRGQGAQLSNSLHKRKWSSWTAVSKRVNVFRIGWAVTEKLQPEHDPKWTCLCNLRPIGSSWWRHFRWKCKDYYVLLNFEVASFSSFREILENHFVTAEAASDIDDSIKQTNQKSVKFSHLRYQCQMFTEYHEQHCQCC